MQSFNQVRIKTQARAVTGGRTGQLSKDCKMMGLSRDPSTAIRRHGPREAWRHARGLAGGKTNRKTRVDEATESGRVRDGLAQPACGQGSGSRVVQKELRKRGVLVAPWESALCVATPRSGVITKRLSAMEKPVAQTGAAHRRAGRGPGALQKQDDPPHAYDRTAHPGYWAPGPLLLGHIKAWAHYSKRSWTPYSKWAVGQVYTTKTPIDGCRPPKTGLCPPLPNMTWRS